MRGLLSCLLGLGLVACSPSASPDTNQSADTSGDVTPVGDDLGQIEDQGKDEEPPAPCEPDCTGKACGDDGCGGPCGSCPAGQTCGVGHQCAPIGDGPFVGVQIEDDPANWTTSGDCDPGPLKSPGADIDAAALEGPGGSVVAWLTACALVDQGSCHNDRADPGQAEGPPDSDGTEGQGAYTALNEGRLRCTFGGEPIGSAGAITIYEVGASIEQYRVRLCNEAGECAEPSDFVFGDVTVPTASLF